MMGELVYEGKAKKLFTTKDPNVLLVQYKDAATAFNGEKKEIIEGKGALNNKITSYFFELLAENQVQSHFLEQLSTLEQLVKRVTIIPLEVVVRNVTAGSFAKRLGLEEGKPLPFPIVEFYYKDDSLGDPLILEDHIYALEITSKDILAQMKEQALEINKILSTHMEQRGIRLVDFKLEFGLDKDGQVLLADEISPDTCRFWDLESGDKLDKDRFRRNLGNVLEAYQEINKRLGGQ
ncbi:phosphoribosylaminoimidazolesuccinocarboxamide synthase [Shimazuella sp. AN120528]|uniref:phosphoribosylaminoimidazolesuccinocarboxamide synthase n=1 Tax=Shimazuella soli TaxID=1892854 RepID=UPI001F0D6A64|nr:phosphoribosylaminoimidazolesuccinocarboxamide synthase [Shimazuella soli]MCH5586608.1 phosphoribosylaminoimidazolesuccinocarboxamide synthase [Shimazuella soli]